MTILQQPSIEARVSRVTGLYQEVVHAAELPQAKLNEIFVAASSPPRNRNLATAGLLFGGILMITSAFNAHPAPAQTLLGAAGVAGGIAYGARQDQKRLAARREILSILAVKHPENSPRLEGIH